MAAYMKAAVSLIEVILFILGVFPVNTNIDYGGGEYKASAITTPMYIVENGSSEFSIAVAENADDCIMTAAEEMQTYIEKISGARLPVISENQLADGAKAVVLGETELEKEITQVDRTAIGADGFLLYSDGNYLLIAGGDSRGTLYGVYTLLEDYLGVRWFTPELEVVTESKDVIVDANLNKTVQPSFAIRRNDTAGTSDAYRARTKMNVSFHYEMEKFGGALTYVLWDVTFDKLVPDALFAEHPEYFALSADGKRTTDHVCVSHPEVLTVAVENARKAILADTKNAKYIHIGQKDNSNYCLCESCTALYEKYGSVSAPTILFTNAFADALDDEFPDFTITF